MRTILWRAVHLVLLVGAVSTSALAQDWQPIARIIPPAGVPLSQEDHEALKADLARLEARVTLLEQSKDPNVRASLPDVEIFAKAVRFALEGEEFYRPQDLKAAQELIVSGLARADQLQSRADKSAPAAPVWATAHGQVVRGYRSAVDDSVQPYGLVIPEGYSPEGRRWPLYVWLHGRNDKLTDLAFISERQRQAGQVKVQDAIVLHPFGRSCLGWKSTAEIDVLEAIRSTSERYAIDPERIVLMGFSMGGAGAWHLGAHYAERWAAVHAGAGFVDVARYQKLKPADYPPAYEQALWGVYDVPDYVRNLFNLPVVAYSGELDKQRDAAEFMAEAFAHEGRTLTHLIGPGMEHKYAEPQWQEVLAKMQQAISAGRNRQPDVVSLQTRTLRYNSLHWVTALALGEHWQDARIDARYGDADALIVTTKNVRRLRLAPPRLARSLTIDGQTVSPTLQTPVTGPIEFQQMDGRWDTAQPFAGLSKKPGLQGPIDDALLEPFLVVLPTGNTNPQADRWAAFEIAHFQRRWQSVYRGRLRVKRDVDVTPDDCRQFHLLAWGDPQSNAVIRQVAGRLPLSWSSDQLIAGTRKFDASHHMLMAIYPNPLAPERYLVLNSGPTHREAHDRTNSLQNPKLPDWAIVDISSAPNDRTAGAIVAADFFDEAWRLKPSAPGDASNPTVPAAEK